jgi:phage terminase large subunit
MTIFASDDVVRDDMRSIRGNIHTRDKLLHRYEPRGSAAEVLRARDDEVLMSGPAGTGKSRGCLEKLLIQALKYPRMKGLIVRKTQVSLGSTALKTWKDHVATEALANGTITYYGGSKEEPPQYRFSNGSAIMMGGMDKPTRIMSSEYDVVYVQEATELTVTDWESITTRLRNGKMPYQQILADCNPDTPTHWLKVRCDGGKTRMINCRHEDNPTLFDMMPDGSFKVTPFGANYMRKLDGLTGVRHLRLRKGLWVAAEGVIFEDFAPEVHIVDPFEIPESWARYWSIDFGFKNPFVCQMWAEDADGRLYLYREIYMTERTVDQHARDILRVVRPDGPGTPWIEPKPQFIVRDHDAENARRFETELGLGTTAADKGVKDGLEVTQRRFRLDKDGRPSIFFFRDAVVERDESLVEAHKPAATLEEIPGYIWLPGIDGKPAKEEPLKMNDHGCDGMRYLCKERDPASRPRIRTFRR